MICLVLNRSALIELNVERESVIHKRKYTLIPKRWDISYTPTHTLCAFENDHVVTLRRKKKKRRRRTYSMCTLKCHKKARDPFELVVLFVRRIMHMDFLFGYTVRFYVQEFYCILLVRFYDFIYILLWKQMLF